MNRALIDTLWQSARYILIAAGMYLAGTNKLDPSQVQPLADSILQLVGLAIAVGSALWGIIVKWHTVPVMEEAAKRRGVPVVSGGTGESTASATK